MSWLAYHLLTHTLTPLNTLFLLLIQFKNCNETQDELKRTRRAQRNVLVSQAGVYYNVNNNVLDGRND